MVTPQEYSHKGPLIHVVRFTGNQTEMEEIRDWLITELPNGNVQLNMTMGTFLQFAVELDGMTVSKIVYPGQYIVKDALGKFFVMERNLLETFYDLES